MSSPEAVAALAAWLRREQEFLLIAHTSPDGDTIGGCLALRLLLLAMGKRVTVVSEHGVPAVYAFLPGAAEVVAPGDVASPPRNAIAVDCATIERMGAAAALFAAAVETGNIDHHQSNPLYGDYVLHDANAAAIGELIYLLSCELLKNAGGLPREVAECLFVAICTDTGNFSYCNANANTFRIAAQLVETGVDIAEINRIVYRTVTLGKSRLKGFVLSNMQLLAEGRIAIAEISVEDIRRAGAVFEDVEGIVDALRDISTVEIAILIRERKDGGFKASLRSKHDVDVARIVAPLGGGGHVHAAGCSYGGSLETLRNQLLRAAEEALA